jgi:hypothetical protein
VADHPVNRAVATLAAVAAAHSAHASAAVNPTATYAYRTLSNPTSGDEFGFRGAIQQNAQGMSDRLFTALQSILGGHAPHLNFVQNGDPSTPNNLSANPTTNTINMDPVAVSALTDAHTTTHNIAVNDMSHESAHLRQILAVLADMGQREGGAQAFADLVTPAAAQRAHIPFTAGSYDGDYAPFVQQINQRPDARSFILGGQFGHAPVAWP